MKIYISGKMRGLPEEESRMKFEAARQYLFDQGHDAVNPWDSEKKKEEQCSEWSDYILYDLQIIKNCDALFMLNNWQDSNGAKCEHAFAKGMGMDIFYEPQEPDGESLEAEFDRYIKKIAPISIISGTIDLRDMAHHFANWQKTKEEPVSTKDKLLALSDGRLHLGWIDDAKVVEFEECLMQFHEDMNNIPQGTDSLTRLKDTDGVLHSYSKKLMSMAKEKSVSEQKLSNVQRTVKDGKEPVSEDLEKACEKYADERLEIIRPDIYDSSYSRSTKMTLDLFEGYELETAFEEGANWQKEQMMKEAVNGLVYAQRTNGEVMFRSNYVRKEGFKFGDKVKVIVINEDRL